MNYGRRKTWESQELLVIWRNHRIDEVLPGLTIPRPNAKNCLLRQWGDDIKEATFLGGQPLSGLKQMSVLQDLDWHIIRCHYLEREQIHNDLLDLNRQKQKLQFVKLLLGITNRAGNFSAYDHSLGRQILATNPNAIQRIFDLANEFISLDRGTDVPSMIKDARLHHFGIGVGSEASCMVNPKVCWIANTRTIFAHLVTKHGGNIAKAKEELRLYRDNDATSRKHQNWAGIHKELATSLTRIAEEGERLARHATVEPGPIIYLWADAIASEVYVRHNLKSSR